jgi:hypothetical protein
VTFISKLVDNGFSALPIAPGTKIPGEFRKGDWRPLYGWTRYCSRRPTDIELDVWSRWPESGVCVCMGAASGATVGIDIDTDDWEIIEAIESVVGQPPVMKRGRKGYTGFFRAAAGVESRGFRIGGKSILDLLAHGRQTVIPPTVHPDTGKAYIWLTEMTLEHVTPERLPLLPDNVAELLADALAPFGYRAPLEHPPFEAAFGRWRDVKTAALENFDAWVPALDINAKRNQVGGYRAQARWRNGDGYNVSFHKTGIRDFASNIGLSAIDVVMMACRLDFNEAEDWLRKRLGMQLEPINHVAQSGRLTRLRDSVLSPERRRLSPA